MSHLISALHAAAAARIRTGTLFSGTKPVPVLTEAIGELEQEITRAINEIGISAVVITPNTAFGGQMQHQTEVTLVLAISEDVLINQSEAGTQKAAGDAAMEGAALWMDWSPGAVWTPIQMRSVTVLSNSPLLIYEAVGVTRTIMRAI